jgi:hypothetical protein
MIGNKSRVIRVAVRTLLSASPGEKKKSIDEDDGTESETTTDGVHASK